MIYFDLDGVLRNLTGAAKIRPKVWDCIIDGVSYIEYISKHKELLEEAKPTNYLNCLNKTNIPINIITFQPKDWYIPTIKWLYKNIFNLKTVIFTKNKLSYLNRNDLLIEDYPYYTDYSQIIVINRLYNRCITQLHTRVNSPSKLLKEIKLRSNWRNQ